jgi:hypothetical protein
MDGCAQELQWLVRVDACTTDKAPSRTHFSDWKAQHRGL